MKLPDTFDPDEEKAFLNSLVKDYTDTHPYSEIKKELIVGLMLDHIAKPMGTGLQFGCANGYESNQLAAHLGHLDVVDGSSTFIDRLKGEVHSSNMSFHLALFEDFDQRKVGKVYDYVSCNYILEHVFDPSVVLGNIHGLMHEESLLFITVPNCMALSRQLALEMGLLKSLSDLTVNDHRHGHRRTYTLDSLRKEVLESGFEIVKEQGVVFKILADFQLNKLLSTGFLTKDHILGLQKLADREENIRLSDSFFLVVRQARS